MKWNKKSNILLFSGLGILSYLLLTFYSGQGEGTSAILHSKKAFLFFIAAFNVLGYAILRISSWLNEQYAANFRHRWRVVATYMACMGLFLLLNYGLLVSAKLLAGSATPFAFPNGGWRTILLVWLVELVVTGLLLSNRSMQNSLKLQQQAAALQEENNRARYTALQNQLNPHFLFNSLNTLIAEIEYNPANAVQFTRQLSNVYRYVLQCQDKTLVTLGEELEFMHSYLFLHEVRLGPCIDCRCLVDEDYTDRQLPPLTLQLLIENVIKHNSISPDCPMPISIRTEDDCLSVSNPIHPRHSSPSSGVGLQNLSNRCRLMLGREISISRDNGTFTVTIPLTYE